MAELQLSVIGDPGNKLQAPMHQNFSFIVSDALAMDKLQLTGQSLGRVFNFRIGHLYAVHLWCY
jgi:hypothetical protein